MIFFLLQKSTEDFKHLQTNMPFCNVFLVESRPFGGDDPFRVVDDPFVTIVMNCE